MPTNPKEPDTGASTPSTTSVTVPPEFQSILRWIRSYPPSAQLITPSAPIDTPLAPSVGRLAEDTVNSSRSNSPSNYLSDDQYNPPQLAPSLDCDLFPNSKEKENPTMH
ncbi:hypothetical protein PCASD_06445 [Puccinia coronata f. sp. avenae]|uniref:Uncharacterized protein n=1 Tax=Puccinia coronata f. sp. avenae TaxID=200324 RepID=A0A2N5UFH7_9BASI|nr:hypothetical protein PCASD_06445 [Puccinia coronata f. sp. avenae]